MGIGYERFAPIKDAPSNSEVTRIHNLLTADEGLFIDKELTLLLSYSETSCILGVPIEIKDIDYSILGDLIIREEIRECSTLPRIYQSEEGKAEGVSLLSVFEYMLKCDGGTVKSPGKFPLDRNQVALQKDVLRRILAQLPDWQTRVASYRAA